MGCVGKYPAQRVTVGRHARVDGARTVELRARLLGLARGYEGREPHEFKHFEREPALAHKLRVAL